MTTIVRHNKGYAQPVCSCGQCFAHHRDALIRNPPNFPENYTQEQVFRYVMLSFLFDECPAGIATRQG